MSWVRVGSPGLPPGPGCAQGARAWLQTSGFGPDGAGKAGLVFGASPRGSPGVFPPVRMWELGQVLQGGFGPEVSLGVCQHLLVLG